MKNKKLLCLLLCVAMLISLLPMAALAETQDGWQREGGQWRYYQEGAPLTGVQELNGYQKGAAAGLNTYFFNEDGTMFKGFMRLNDQWVYFGETGYSPLTSAVGSMYKSRYVLNPVSGYKTKAEKEKNRDYAYYFDAEGVMITGWLNVPIGGKDRWMYFGDDGADPTTSRLGRQSRYGMVFCKGGFDEYDTHFYLFSATGVMKTGVFNVKGETIDFCAEGENPAKDELGSGTNRVITTQPVDTEFVIPNPVEVKVEVQEPDKCEFQWQTINDAEEKWEDIEGATDVSFGFNITDRATRNMKLRCKVSDSELPGYMRTSNVATFVCTGEPEKAWLIVDSEPVMAGESTKAGEGTVALSEDGQTITLDNATIDSVGKDISVALLANTKQEGFDIVVKGKNVINGTDGADQGLLLFDLDASYPPTYNFTGDKDASLSICAPSAALNTLDNAMVNIKGGMTLNVKTTNAEGECVALKAGMLDIAEDCNVTVDMKTYKGLGIDDTLSIAKGANVAVTSEGANNAYLVIAKTLNIDAATLTADVTGLGESIIFGISVGDLNATNGAFVRGWLKGEEKSTMLRGVATKTINADNSTILGIIDAPASRGAIAVFAMLDIKMTNDAFVSGQTRCAEHSDGVFSLMTNPEDLNQQIGEINVTDSTLIGFADSGQSENQFGIETTRINIDVNSVQTGVFGITNGNAGMGLACNLSWVNKERRKFEEDYKSEGRINLKGLSVFADPAAPIINVNSVYDPATLVYPDYETVYYENIDGDIKLARDVYIVAEGLTPPEGEDVIKQLIDTIFETGFVGPQSAE